MTDKTLLITRPLGDERALAALMHTQGYRVIHEPLTSVTLEHTQRMALTQALMQDPSGVILTSRHAVHALAMLTELRDIFLLCVGEATANVAYSHGFERVTTCGGTAEKLVNFIIDSYDSDSHFLYLSGKHTRMNLEAALGDCDIHVQRIEVYETEPADQLSDTLVEQIRRTQLDGVTLLSPRTSQIFVRLLDKAGILPEAANTLHAFCISEAAAAPLLEQGWAHAHHADQPTLASVMQCIDNVFGDQP